MTYFQYKPEYLAELRQNLDEYFNDGELRNLCFDLDVSYDNLPGEEKASKARELVDYMKRHGQIPDLVQAAAKQRLHADWRFDQAAAVCYKKKGDAVKFLLVRTSGNRWLFPKGKLEPGESALKVAQLAARDKAGVAGTIDPHPLTVFKLPQRQARSTGQEAVVAAFLLRVKEKIRPDERGRQRKWYTPDEAKEMLSKDREPPHDKELTDVIDAACSHLAA